MEFSFYRYLINPYLADPLDVIWPQSVPITLDYQLFTINNLFLAPY